MANVAITAIVTNITVDCIAPTIKASPTHTLIEVPLRYSKIVYVQPLTDGLAPEFIEHLIELGYSVEVVPYTQAAGYDYSNPTVKLCFVGGTYSWSSNYYNF